MYKLQTFYFRWEESNTTNTNDIVAQGQFTRDMPAALSSRPSKVVKGHVTLAAKQGVNRRDTPSKPHLRPPVISLRRSRCLWPTAQRVAAACQQLIRLDWPPDGAPRTLKSRAVSRHA